jgi:hypothetical protein
MKSSPTKPQAFRPLIDWWVMGAMLLLIAFLAAAIPLIAIVAQSTILTVIAIVVLAGTILYIVDVGFFSYYVLDDNALTVVSNIRHAIFPYRDMTDIKPSNVMGLFSFAGKKRYALSARCFQIVLRKGYWKSITVSPADRDFFLNSLISHIDRERSSRATIERSKK